MERHPFKAFVPEKTRYLFLGTFTGKVIPGYDWFYANKRNQFWPIIEEVFGEKLETKQKKQNLFLRLQMAITDIILECEREADNNMDTNLTNLIINSRIITNILAKYPVERIYFSSRFAESLFKKYFKNLVLKHSKIELVTLPSPSPRYATMSRKQKVEVYKRMLPKIKE